MYQQNDPRPALPGPSDAPVPLWDLSTRELLAFLDAKPGHHGAVSSTLLAKRLRLEQQWEKRARYAEAALRTIIGAPGITLDSAKQIAQNYFDGRDAIASGVGEGYHTDGAVQRACAGENRAAPMPVPASPPLTDSQ